MKNAFRRSQADPTVSAQEPITKLKKLESASIVELRILWRSLNLHDPPPAFGPALLRHAIAHRLQERTCEPMTRTSQRLLKQAIKVSASQDVSKFNRRQINPGSEFARTWKGKMHRVAVLSDGYGYAGKTYQSLSEIARLITGTQWNGPRFFGFRGKHKNGE